MARLIAFFIIVIPGLVAVYGVKIMRDTIFGILLRPYPFLWMQFLAGLLFFVFGLAIVGGFIFHRDRKRNKVQKRFKK